jgi:hypothetical protein
MKQNLIKFFFAASVAVTASAFSFGSAKANVGYELEVSNDDGGGGLQCPTGDKYKCAEKNGYVVYKGEGATVVN